MAEQPWDEACRSTRSASMDDRHDDNDHHLEEPWDTTSGGKDAASLDAADRFEHRTEADDTHTDGNEDTSNVEAVGDTLASYDCSGCSGTEVA